MCCEHCGTQQVQPLEETEFGLLLANGVVSLACKHCGKTTTWKLVLSPGLEPRLRGQRTPGHVLLIDDDPDTLRVLQMVLRSKEYTVHAALSADEAVQKLQTADFDVIVSDIMMPGFDGRNLYRFLLVYLPGCAQRVIFLTGDKSERTLHFLKECGRPYLFKPVGLHELQSCIREML